MGEEAPRDEVREAERAQQREMSEPMDGLDRRAAEREERRVHEERARRLMIEGISVWQVACQPMLRHVGVRALVALEGNRRDAGAHGQRERGDEGERKDATPHAHLGRCGRLHRTRHRVLRRVARQRG